jgi:hypothetical protein
MAQFTVIDKNGFQKMKTGLVSLSDLSPNASANLSDGTNIALLNANNHFTGAGNQIFDGNVEPATTQMFSWNSRTAGTIYQAASDGLVVVVFSSTNLVNAANQITGFSDNSSGPTTIRADWTSTIAAATALVESFMFPVRKGDYYKVVAAAGVGGSFTPTMWWVPLGTAG